MVTITEENVHEYREGVFEGIREVRWEVKGNLDSKVLQNFPNLRAFQCGFDKSLRSLAGIEVCTQLESLNCIANSLQNLDALLELRMLKIVYLTCNKLTSLSGLRNCVRLKDLFCSGNQLSDLRGLEACTELQSLSCGENRLITLTGLENCVNLQSLTCNRNRLIELNALTNCHQLYKLECYSNQITSLEPLVYLQQLRDLKYANNPLAIQTVRIQRFLGRMPETNKGSSSVYSNSQNVHDIHIQKTVCESVQRLLTDPKPEFTIEMIINSELDERAIRLIVEYCGDVSIHSRHLLAYIELLAFVWARITRSEHKDELIKILGEQILDAECKCFTGRFNRTLSVLVGFYPDIVIEISDNSRIGAIIIAVKDIMGIYDPVIHREHAQTLLLEAGYDAVTIQPWLEAITEA